MPAYNQYSDNELLALLYEGDHAAYTEIFHRYKKILYLHSYRLLKNREDASEVVQELFIALWSCRERLRINKSLSAYLYASVRNRVIKSITRKQIESEYFSSIRTYMDAGNVITDHPLREKELASMIEREISLLPPKMRIVFCLSRKGYLSHQEIAERLNLSAATVKKQVNNALKILRVKLQHFLSLLF